MSRTFAVHVGALDVAIGALRYDRDGRREHAAFSYTEDWLVHADRFAVSSDLPLVGGFQFPSRLGKGSVFPGATADTEPDGWGRRLILRAHAKRRQASRVAAETPTLGPVGSLDFLLAVDDESRVGALRFRDEDGVFQGSSAGGARRTPPLLELGQLVAASRAAAETTCSVPGRYAARARAAGPHQSEGLEPVARGLAVGGADQRRSPPAEPGDCEWVDRDSNPGPTD